MHQVLSIFCCTWQASHETLIGIVFYNNRHISVCRSLKTVYLLLETSPTSAVTTALIPNRTTLVMVFYVYANSVPTIELPTYKHRRTKIMNIHHSTQSNTYHPIICSNLKNPFHCLQLTSNCICLRRFAPILMRVSNYINLHSFISLICCLNYLNQTVAVLVSVPCFF